jgi:lysozyme
MNLSSLFKEQPKQPDPNSITANYIKQNEGYNPNIYVDTKKIPTTGYGFNLKADNVKQFVPKDVIAGKRALTLQESDSIFSKVYTQSVSDAKTFVSPEVFDKLSNSQKQALIDMSYNLGLTKLNKFNNLREALYNGDVQSASKEVLNSKYAKELPARAIKNATLMLK